MKDFKITDNDTTFCVGPCNYGNKVALWDYNNTINTIHMTPKQTLRLVRALLKAVEHAERGQRRKYNQHEENKV